MLSHADRLRLGIAIMTEGSILIANESCIGQFLIAVLASEALWMPVGGHRFDNPPNNKLPAFVAARSEQDMEVPLAVLPTLELVENSIGERPEALGAPEKKVGVRKMQFFYE